jgi:hypothetical protein
MWRSQNDRAMPTKAATAVTARGQLRIPTGGHTLVTVAIGRYCSPDSLTGPGGWVCFIQLLAVNPFFGLMRVRRFT